MQKTSVLVVDDDPKIRKLLSVNLVIPLGPLVRT
jgi:hypothetical protein